MKAVIRKPLMEKRNWAVIGLIIAFTLFGLVSFIGQRILSGMVMKNKIDISAYHGAVYNFNLTVGILASAALAFFFAACIVNTSGSRRAAFIAGLFSSIAPVFGALSTVILFEIIGLPSMGAGSVIASAVSAALLIIPCFIMFCIFVFNRTLSKGSRLLSFIVGFLALLIAFLPVAITVLAFVVMPNNPMMGPLMQLSAYLIHVRPIMIALGLGILYFMNRS
ncbi:MAG TPA: hypothetical protein GX505_01995 [Clostridiales bacterium]|nr:hypothetical protein [Clostridiales bacterium]